MEQFGAPRVVDYLLHCSERWREGGREGGRKRERERRERCLCLKSHLFEPHPCQVRSFDYLTFIFDKASSSLQPSNRTVGPRVARSPIDSGIQHANNFNQFHNLYHESDLRRRSAEVLVYD